VPFYGCPKCGWATTASRSNALQAHRVRAPDCVGGLELIAEWLLPGDEPERSASRRDPSCETSTTTGQSGA
jgi:hypothetical protein